MNIKTYTPKIQLRDEVTCFVGMHMPGNDDHTFAISSQLDLERGGYAAISKLYLHENDDHSGCRRK